MYSGGSSRRRRTPPRSPRRQYRCEFEFLLGYFNYKQNVLWNPFSDDSVHFISLLNYYQSFVVTAYSRSASPVRRDSRSVYYLQNFLLFISSVSFLQYSSNPYGWLFLPKNLLCTVWQFCIVSYGWVNCYFFFTIIWHAIDFGGNRDKMQSTFSFRWSLCVKFFNEMMEPSIYFCHVWTIVVVIDAVCCY